MGKLMAPVPSIMPTVMYTRDNSTMIKQTAMESIRIRANKNTKDGGNQMSNMAKEKKLCQMAQYLLVDF